MLLGTQRINGNGRLEIGGCDAVELARRFGTPLYVMDEATIRSKCRQYLAAFGEHYPSNIVCYASKAFLCSAMCRIIDEEGLSLDVASHGELYTALHAGFPPARINLHGSNKCLPELRLAVKAGIGHIIVDNDYEIDLLAPLLRRLPAGHAMKVLVRCSPGVDPDTHRFMSTGQADTKFGQNISDGSALATVKRVLQVKGLAFDGIHFHIGSQLLDTESHEGAIDAAVGLMAAIKRECGVDCPILNIGGGLGVRYRSHHEPPTFDAFAVTLADRLRAALAAAGLPEPTLAQEPGRSIVGEAGTTLYTIGAIKTVPIVEEPGLRTYASVDGGLSDNPRPQMYGAEYEVILANRASEPSDRTVTIAGRHCETDVLVWNAAMPMPDPGDVLAVQTTGAYNYAMASNYNRFLRSSVVLVHEGEAELIVEREKPADIVRKDRMPARLVGR